MRSTGRFRLQVSLRERPTLAVAWAPLKHQAYFAHLEFQPFEVPSRQLVEMIAEKVRAAFQRAKVRDLYDLHRLAATRFDGELLRRLVDLKLWQVRDPFDANTFFAQLRGEHYDWEDLRRLLRSGDRVEPQDVIHTVEQRYEVLRSLTELELQVVADARSGWNEPLADRLRLEIQTLAGET